jgi:hypothetical protein
VIETLDAKVECTIKAGCKRVLISYENEQDYIKLLIQTKKSIEIV